MLPKSTSDDVEQSLPGYSSQFCEEKEAVQKKKEKKQNQVGMVVYIFSSLGPNSTIISVLFTVFLFCLPVEVK